MDALRAERDRFVAFSFTAADALVEVDAEGAIAYAAGATHMLGGETGGALTGRAFLEAITAGDRRMVRAAIRASRRRGRFGPLPIDLCGADGDARPVTLSGSHLPELGDHIYLTIAARRRSADSDGEDDALAGAEAFSMLATEAMKINASQPIAMSLLAIDGLAQLLEQLEPEKATDLTADIEAELRANALDGSAAGGLSPDRYGIVHDSDVDIPDLKKTIAAHTRGADPTGKTLAVRSSTVSLAAGDLSESDCAKALLYTINAFAKGKGDFSITDMLQGYRRMRSETIRQVRSHRKVISSGAFDVLFQPIVDLGDHTVHHYEALMRLRKNGPAASPSEFITFAEEVGVIGEFDLAMCRKVIGKIESAAARGDELLVAVNLSGRSLGTDGFIDALHDLLKNSTGIAGHLIFEVTESSRIADLPATNRVLGVLRTAGYAVCLDDFGSGATAYQYLRELDVDFVKIDGAYVRDALTTPNGKAFLRSMTTLCKELKIDTIGEMVETEAEARFLAEAGVNYGQGYLFGRPSAGLIRQRRSTAAV